MKQWTACAVVLALAGTAGAGRAAGGEDDLAIVKKAVASPAPRVRGTQVAAAEARVIGRPSLRNLFTRATYPAFVPLMSIFRGVVVG